MKIQEITYIGARKVMKEMTLPAKQKEKKGVKIRRFAKVFKGVPSYLLGEEDKSLNSLTRYILSEVDWFLLWVKL
jgi:hypothetical protein